MNFTNATAKLPLPKLIEKFEAIKPEEEQDNSSEELSFAIAEKGKDGIKFLKSRIDGSNDNQLRCVLTVLPYFCENDGDVKRLLKESLTDKRPLIVAAAVEGFTTLEFEDNSDEIKALMAHESPHVKSSVLRYLARMHPDLAYPVLIGSLKHSDYIVRQNACDELGELGNAEAVPFLKPLTKDAHPDVRDAAKTAIEMLEN